MHVPYGFTAQEVLDAGSNLPPPKSEYLGRDLHVAVHNFPGAYHVAPSQESYKYQASVRMRVLSFRLTDRIDVQKGGEHVFVWELVGAR